MINKWIFVIDTDAYAGNFERDLCAYITGVIGECEVGDEFAALYRKETGDGDGVWDGQFVDYVEQREEYGCARPCSCWPSPKQKGAEHNNSVAIFFNKKPTSKLIALMKERAGKFAEAKRKIAEEEDLSWDKNFKLTIHGFRLVQEKTTTEEENV